MDKAHHWNDRMRSKLRKKIKIQLSVFDSDMNVKFHDGLHSFQSVNSSLILVLKRNSK